jgi:hypothetical protein
MHMAQTYIFLKFFLLFICAYNVWVISPPAQTYFVQYFHWSEHEKKSWHGFPLVAPSVLRKFQVLKHFEFQVFGLGMFNLNTSSPNFFWVKISMSRSTPYCTGVYVCVYVCVCVCVCVSMWMLCVCVCVYVNAVNLCPRVLTGWG